MKFLRDVKMNTVKKIIAECAMVIPGVLEQKSSGKVLCTYDAVLPNQITTNGFIREYGTLQRAQTDSTPFLETGDVIIKRLNPDCAVIFEDKSVRAVPTANLFVIRPYTDILDPYYLAFMLESSGMLKRISQRSGIETIVSAVTVNQIQNSEIPLPSLKIQRNLGNLWNCAKKRNSLLQEMINENGRLLQSLSRKLYFNT